MKLENSVLAIEQSKHLQELGLDMSDAAYNMLCWVIENGYLKEDKKCK